MKSLEPEQIITRILQQLDRMFGGKDPNQLLLDPRIPNLSPAERPNPSHPASQYYLDHFIMDWGQDPFVLGGYSSPSRGEDPSTRDALAEPIDDRIFFCGEHTNRSFMSIHGKV